MRSFVSLIVLSFISLPAFAGERVSTILCAGAFTSGGENFVMELTLTLLDDTNAQATAKITIEGETQEFGPENLTLIKSTPTFEGSTLYLYTFTQADNTAALVVLSRDNKSGTATNLMSDDPSETLSCQLQ